MNQVYTIPEYFVEGSLDIVNVHFYQTQQSSSKNKITLSQNLLCIVTKGEKEIVNATQKTIINHQSICLLTSGNVLMTERTAATGEYESFLLFFSNDFLLDMVEKHHISLPKAIASQPQVLLVSKDDYILHYQKSLEMLKADMRGQTNIKRAKLEEIFIYLLERYPDAARHFVYQSMNQINLPLIKMVQKHLFDNMTQEELAFLCSMSVSTFKRKFREVYQTSPQKYFIQQKMEKAKTLLQQGLSSSETSVLLGYESLSSFSTAFKNYFGTPPSGISS